MTSLNGSNSLAQKGNPSIPAGSGPAFLVYDPANHLDYVDNFFSSNVTIFCGICVSGHTSVTVGANPAGLCWDQARHSIYVVQQATPTIWIIKGISVSSVSAAAGAPLLGDAYDEATDSVYATGWGNGAIYIFS